MKIMMVVVLAEAALLAASRALYHADDANVFSAAHRSAAHFGAFVLALAGTTLLALVWWNLKKTTR